MYQRTIVQIGSWLSSACLGVYEFLQLCMQYIIGEKYQISKR